MFGTDDLYSLIEHEGGPCVSVFMPAHRAGREVRQDPIRFKNLLAQAQEELIAQGMRTPEAAGLLQAGFDLQADGRFWRLQDHGLAVFMARDFIQHYGVPISLPELVVVNDGFHVKPLIPVLARDGLFFVLAFDERRVRLFEASRHAMDEIRHPDLPRGLVEILEQREMEANVGFHVSAPYPKQGTDTAPPQYHAAGESPEDYLKKEVVEYVRLVAREMDRFLSGRNVPLVLVADAPLQGFYRKASRYEGLAPEPVTKNAGALDEDEIHALAYAVVEPGFDQARREARERIEAALQEGSGRASNRLEEIVPAAHHGRVDSLFVATDNQRWGRFDPVAERPVEHQQRGPGDADLLDVAAAATLRNGGAVFAVSAAEVPWSGAAAALFRYAV